MEIVEHELISAIGETVKHHLFDTTEELGKVLQEKYNIPRENIIYEMVNGVNELTIKIPGAIKSIPLKITVLGEEVVIE